MFRLPDINVTQKLNAMMNKTAPDRDTSQIIAKNPETALKNDLGMTHLQEERYEDDQEN